MQVGTGSLVCREIGIGPCGECGATAWEYELVRIDYERLAERLT